MNKALTTTEKPKVSLTKKPKVSLTKTYCQECSVGRGSAGIYVVTVWTPGIPARRYLRVCPAHALRLALPLPGRSVVLERPA